jgi:hypothetical protein
MGRGSGAGKVVDPIDLELEGIDDVMPHQLEAGIADQVLDIGLPTGEEVIEADDVMPLTDKAIAKVGAEKSGTAGNEDTHGGCCVLVAVKEKRSLPALESDLKKQEGSELSF